ncbi:MULTISPECIES: heme A synthase [unclassified Corynebacterium]|uniref:COX15/CtaA family protein n=1 Tax=unclassified Corynebacterium TaxID=2624378 RepID=UPI003523629A
MFTHPIRWFRSLLAGPEVRVQRRLAMVLLVCQAGITVTGSIVRVTGSGLGCVTWPNCQPGSLVPVAGAAPWIHQAIEWGNRLLTFVVATAALLVFIAVLRSARRREVLVLAFIQGIGVIVQAILGGISVHLELRWWSVAMHFLPSMLLIWLAAVLWVRIAEPDNGSPTETYPRPLRHLAILSATSLAIVLGTGTMVTGAGVHSGDPGVGMEGRLNIDLVRIANIHAHFMYLYLGLTVGLVIALVTVGAALRARRIGWILIGFIILQAAIGIIQFNFGVPRWTVPVHVGLSGTVVAFTGVLFAYGRDRVGGKTGLTGSPRGDTVRRSRISQRS